jgi:hypothetical protein
MKNSELLKRDRRSLTGLDRQRHYVLATLVTKNRCPNCGTQQNFFEGSGIAIDDWQDIAGGTPCRCIACGRELNYVVPFFAMLGRGGWYWSLVPIAPKGGAAP